MRSFTATSLGLVLTHSRTQVNVISPIFLSLLLAPKLLRTGQSDIPGQERFIPRIIFTGSTVAEIAPTKAFNVDSPLAGLDSEKGYRGGDRYNESKVTFYVMRIPPINSPLQLVLHCLSRHLTSLQPKLIITDVNPGFVDTPLYRSSPGPMVFLVRRIGRTAEAGARNCSMAMLTLTQSEDVSLRNRNPELVDSIVIVLP